MPTDNAATVLAYHERSKHRLARYAAGPDTLDWDAQPDPFRRFAGAPITRLPLPADDEKLAWTRIFSPGAVTPHAGTLESLGLLFELSFALSAWKQLGPDRWAMRCNPSSGNLHPTEVYLLARGLGDVDDGLYHYAPKEHALEQRARVTQVARVVAAPRLLVGFSSIHWREAWKYGERAVFVVALLAEFNAQIEGAPWRYRELLQEAGLIGQVLYLEAEAAALRGTGIGCYFDDSVHELLGFSGKPSGNWQVLYHFSVGVPVQDDRIASTPPYSWHNQREAVNPLAHICAQPTEGAGAIAPVRQETTP